MTRLEIIFAVHQVCQAMHSATDSDFAAVKRILKYPKGTITYGLHFSPGPLTHPARTKSDWAADTKDHRSISGSCVFLGNNPIIWLAKKQAIVAKSTMEAEYKVMAFAAVDLMWLKMLLQDFQIQLLPPSVISCDNLSVLALTLNPVFHARTKHAAVEFHFIHEKVQDR